jgi:tetratricopeptide (TPR) repeat protein
LLSPKKRITAQLVVALAAATLSGCGPPRTTVVEDSSLETAIACFIDGDLDRAETLFEEITHEPHSDEDYRSAYLYLGRIYLARGDYVKAADALSAGRALGDDARFDEYFEIARRNLATTPARVGQISGITRGELAALLDHVFGSMLRGRNVEPGSSVEGDSVPTADPRDAPVELVTRAGLMDFLPDGEFHPEEKVSWPAFYIISNRIVDSFGGDRKSLSDAFPRGYRGTIYASPGVHGETASGQVVSGREALRICEALASALQLDPVR